MCEQSDSNAFVVEIYNWEKSLWKKISATKSVALKRSLYSNMQSTNILCNSSLASNPIEFKLIAGDTKNVCVDDND